MRILMAVCGLYLALVSCGCSIAMALHGNQEPNFDNLKVGSAREEVEIEFKNPTSVKDLEGGKKEVTYTYQMGNSSNPARATLYGLIDLYTIGLAEPILSLIEVFQGREETTGVVYGSDLRVLEIHGFLPPPISPELKAAQEAQKVASQPSSRPVAGQGGYLTNPGAPLSIDPQVRELASTLSRSLKEQDIKRIAVLPIQDISGVENTPLGNFLTEKLTTHLHALGAARIVERAQLARVRQELAITHSGSFNEESAKEIGRLLGVDAIVTSSYANLGQQGIEMNSRAVRVETGEIVGASSAQIPRAAVESILH